MISLDQFEASLRARTLSEHTVRAYTRAWSQVLGRCAVEDVALEAVEAGRARIWWTEWTRTLGSSGQVQMMAALQRGFRLANLPNPFAEIEVRGIDPAKRKIKYLTVTQVAQLLGKLAERRHHDYLHALVHVLSVVLFHTGKRYGDILSIQWTDVIRAGDIPTLLRIVTKGAKHEDVPLPTYAAQALQEFYGMVQATRSSRLLKPGGMVFARSPYVFASRNGLPLKLEVYNQHLRSAGAACGVGKVSSHIWRHSLATYLLNDQRRNLREVQEILGHVRLETTARYTHIQSQARRDILSSICLPTIPS